MKRFINNIVDLVKKNTIVEHNDDGEWICITETKHLLFGYKHVYEKYSMKSNPSISYCECYEIDKRGNKTVIWTSNGF